MNLVLSRLGSVPISLVLSRFRGGCGGDRYLVTVLDVVCPGTAGGLADLTWSVEEDSAFHAAVRA